MDTNDLLKLAGKELMTRVNRSDTEKRRKKKDKQVKKQSSFWFGNLPFLIRCSISRKKRDGRAG